MPPHFGSRLWVPLDFGYISLAYNTGPGLRPLVTWQLILHCWRYAESFRMDEIPPYDDRAELALSFNSIPNCCLICIELSSPGILGLMFMLSI